MLIKNLNTENKAMIVFHLQKVVLEFLIKLN